MQYKTLKDFTGWGALGILLVFIGAGFILAGIVQLFIAFQMFPGDVGFDKIVEQLPEVMKKPENLVLVQISQVLGTLLLFFVPAVLYSLVVNGKNKFWLGFNKYVTLQQIFVGFCIIFLANIVAGPLADLSKYIVGFFPDLNARAIHLEKLYNEQLMAMSNLKSWGQYILAIFVIAFFPAVFEEVFFRGALQTLLVKWIKLPILAILVTAVLFSFIHGSIYLFLSRFVLGMVLGLLFYEGKNIWVNIIAHFLNNAIAVTTLFVHVRSGKAVDPSTIDPEMPWWAGIAALLAVVAVFLYFRKISRRNVEKIHAKEKILLALSDPFAGFAGEINK